MLIGDSGKILGLGDLLPDQAVHVFVCPSFSGGIGMRKKEFGLQMAGDPFVIGKFLANICGQGVVPQ